MIAKGLAASPGEVTHNRSRYHHNTRAHVIQCLSNATIFQIQRSPPRQQNIRCLPTFVRLTSGCSPARQLLACTHASISLVSLLRPSLSKLSSSNCAWFLRVPCEGAGVGKVVFTAADAVSLSKKAGPVVLVCPGAESMINSQDRTHQA